MLGKRIRRLTNHILKGHILIKFVSNIKMWLLPGEKKAETRYYEGVAEQNIFLL